MTDYDEEEEDITVNAPVSAPLPDAVVKEGLERQAKELQSSLLALLDRIDKVREEHEKMEGENKFLQDYIGNLMQTSKITGGKGR